MKYIIIASILLLSVAAKNDTPSFGDNFTGDSCGTYLIHHVGQQGSNPLYYAPKSANLDDAAICNDTLLLTAPHGIPVRFALAHGPGIFDDLHLNNATITVDLSLHDVPTSSSDQSMLTLEYGELTWGVTLQRVGDGIILTTLYKGFEESYSFDFPDGDTSGVLTVTFKEFKKKGQASKHSTAQIYWEGVRIFNVRGVPINPNVQRTIQFSSSGVVSIHNLEVR